jgi:phosphatidylserine/phosphatidylglycerophosphate/cardiolipin synthase-like enzyme
MARIAIAVMLLLVLAVNAGAIVVTEFGTLAEIPLETVVTVRGVLVADFWRDLFLSDCKSDSGLRLRTGEHLAEVGELLLVTGTLKFDERSGDRFLQVVEPLTDIVTLRRQEAQASIPSAGALQDDPEAWRGCLVELPELVVTKLRRDANAEPWLMTVEDTAGREIAVELQDGQHPVLVEGDLLPGLRGVWRRNGEHWNLRPRSAEDFLFAEGVFRGGPPAERRLSFKGHTLEGKIGGLIGRAPRGRALLDAVCYDPPGPGDGESGESFAVINTGDRKLKLGGWSVSDNEGVWRFPPRSELRPGESLRVARSFERFTWLFGFPPDLAMDRHPSPADSALILDNGGDELLLLDEKGRLVDALVWEEGWSDEQPGWEGKALAPYRFSSFVPAEGQVFWRKRDLEGGVLPDSDRAADWMADPDDPVLGQRLAYPGWDSLRFFDTARCEEVAEFSAFVSPDNSFAGLRSFLRTAKSSIEMEFYLFTHPGVYDELVAAMERGVRVTLLLNGEVYGARGGTYESVRWIAGAISAHPSGLGRAYLWRNGDDPRHLGPDADLPDRYNHPHQKFIIVDRERVLVGSDNLTQSSLPADDPADGTGGSRGAFLVTDASCIVERVVAIWEADFDPRRQRDIHEYVTRPELEERQPRLSRNREDYLQVQPEPFLLTGLARFELSHSPDNALRPDRGYLGHVNAAGAGDLIMVEQQYERPWWGYADRREPNPRLAAYLAAARRGARVRILLSGTGAPGRDTKNILTMQRFNSLAEEEGLDLRIALGYLPDSRAGRSRPIHNKMLLVRAGEAHWSHVGSANGSETAHRFNRELGLSIDSEALYAYLAEVFVADWLRATGEEPR